MRWPSSLRARLTLWYTLLLAVPLVLFAVISYVVVQRALENRTDLFINDALTAFSRELAAERRVQMSTRDAVRSTSYEMRFRDLRITVRDTAGRTLAETPGEHDGAVSGPFRVASQTVTVEGERFELVGAYPAADLAHVLARIRGLFLIAIPLLLLSAAIGGYLLARRSLAPVAAMARQAADISASSMHQRLPVTGGDELVELARVVNGLLDRLEHSFTQQRRFVADASHELRTPTAVICSEADITLSREHRSEGEYRSSMEVMQSTGRRLTRIVDDLFLLARADAGHLPARRDTIYLDEVVHDATRAIASVAAARGVTIDLHHVVDAQVTGDADLLGRLLLNLLDNAVKHSPEGGSVEVSMRRNGTRHEVSVVDQGPGIPPDLHARVFERFFRVDSARSRAERTTTSGAGLGLAIAQRIAEMHGGSVRVAESRAGRTEMTLEIGIGL